jgi:glycerol-1-phosphate dehydrogenase [NAD(P)+]
LEVIGAPTSAKALGTDEDTILVAITAAQNSRPDRYTILASGVTKTAAQLRLEKTGIV